MKAKVSAQLWSKFVVFCNLSSCVCVLCAALLMREWVDPAEVGDMIINAACLHVFYEIFMKNSLSRVNMEEQRLEISFILFSSFSPLPLSSFRLVISFLPSSSHPFFPPTPPSSLLFYCLCLSVEEPLGEFSSRQILQNEKKLPTR